MSRFPQEPPYLGANISVPFDLSLAPILQCQFTDNIGLAILITTPTAYSITSPSSPSSSTNATDFGLTKLSLSDCLVARNTAGGMNIYSPSRYLIHKYLSPSRYLIHCYLFTFTLFNP